MSYFRNTISNYSTNIPKNYGLENKYINNHKSVGIRNRGNIMGNVEAMHEYESEITKRVKATGSLMGGYIPLNNEGNPVINGLILDPYSGQYVETDGTGKVICINKDHIDDAIELTEEENNKIQSVANYIFKLPDNTIMANILSFSSVGELRSKLGAGATFKTATNEDLDTEVINVNAMPSVLPGLSNEKLALAKIKIRELIRTRLRYINLVSFSNKKTDKNNENYINPMSFNDPDNSNTNNKGAGGPAGNVAASTTGGGQ